MIKPLRSDEVWHPKRGAPFGNANALKSGRHTNEMKDLAKRIAAWRRHMRATLAAVDAIANVPEVAAWRTKRFSRTRG